MISPGFRQAFSFILVLTFAGSLFLAARLNADGFEAKRVAIQGTVKSERSWGRGRVVLLDSRDGRFVVHLPPSGLFREGEKIRVKGLVEPLGPHPGDPGFDEGTYWKARGVDGILRHAEAEPVKETSKGISWWRSLLRERVLKTMPPLMRGHLLAAWLGARDPDLARRHAVWGTSHLLAVSGLHVGIVVFLLFLVLPVRFFRLSIASSAMWLYVLIAGASSSALRAGLMLQTGFVGRWIGRPLAAVNTVSVAGLLLLLWRPWFFWDLGWQLSMLAAILLSSLHDLGAKRAWYLAPVLLWVCTAGLVSDAFGSVPVAGMAINFIAVPVFGVLLPAASLLALPALAGIPGGWLTAGAGEILFSAWAYIADLMAVLLPWEVVPSSVLNIFGVLLAAFLLLRAIGFRRISAAVFAGGITVCLTML
ncbi:MAG: ComEC/Rec2 family competence protein [Thermovirgaceae bacterium]|nr:ComEC/Rec2 family competence protein [Thermovirgaceae bacterium]